MNYLMKDGNELQTLVNYIMDNYYADGSYPNKYVEDVAGHIMNDFKYVGGEMMKNHLIKTAIKYIETDLHKED